MRCERCEVEIGEPLRKHPDPMYCVAILEQENDRLKRGKEVSAVLWSALGLLLGLALAVMAFSVTGPAYLSIFYMVGFGCTFGIGWGLARYQRPKSDDRRRNDPERGRV